MTGSLRENRVSESAGPSGLPGLQLRIQTRFRAKYTRKARRKSRTIPSLKASTSNCAFVVPVRRISRSNQSDTVHLNKPKNTLCLIGNLLYSYSWVLLYRQMGVSNASGSKHGYFLQLPPWFFNK